MAAAVPLRDVAAAAWPAVCFAAAIVPGQVAASSSALRATRLAEEAESASSLQEARQSDSRAAAVQRIELHEVPAFVSEAAPVAEQVAAQPEVSASVLTLPPVVERLRLGPEELAEAVVRA